MHFVFSSLNSHIQTVLVCRNTLRHCTHTNTPILALILSPRSIKKTGRRLQTIFCNLFFYVPEQEIVYLNPAIPKQCIHYKTIETHCLSSVVVNKWSNLPRDPLKKTKKNKRRNYKTAKVNVELQRIKQKNEVKTQKQYEKTATSFSRCRKTVEVTSAQPPTLIYFPFNSKLGSRSEVPNFIFKIFRPGRYEIVQSNFVFFSFAAWRKEYQSMY